jgi:hypothetical protein
MKTMKLMFFFVGIVTLVSLFAPGVALAQEADPPPCCIGDPADPETPPTSVAIVDNGFVPGLTPIDFIAFAPDYLEDKNEVLSLSEDMFRAGTEPKRRQS